MNDETFAFPDGDLSPAGKLGDIAAQAGLRRVNMVAWRDLEHPEAGGSEVHAARVAERWAAAGIDVELITSRSPGTPSESAVDGYRIRRLAGRYTVFPAAAARAVVARRAPPDATVEIWNGMPFFTPIWTRPPRVVFIHHVHAEMWDSVLPRRLAAVGKFVEKRLAPPLYRSTPVVTLSDSSRQAIVDILGFDPSKVTVVRPGIDESFIPGRSRSPHPFVVAVGRLVPYKRFDRLIEVLVQVKKFQPDLEAVVAGEGSERPALVEAIGKHRAGSWISLPGRVSAEDLVALYQRAWLLVSTSAHEGWGLTISEAAACATPAVASPISGHLDAVSHGSTGLLAEPGPAMVEAVRAVLADQLLRRRLQRGAWREAQGLNWDRTALEILQVLAGQAGRFR